MDNPSRSRVMMGGGRGSEKALAGELLSWGCSTQVSSQMEKCEASPGGVRVMEPLGHGVSGEGHRFASSWDVIQSMGQDLESPRGTQSHCKPSSTTCRVWTPVYPPVHWERQDRLKTPTDTGWAVGRICGPAWLSGGCPSGNQA